MRRLGAGALVICRGALLPLVDSLRVDAVPLGECPQALLTVLYRSTDRRSRTGTPVENPAHSPSLHPDDKSAPSNPRIKHLAFACEHSDNINDTINLYIRKIMVTWQVKSPFGEFICDWVI